MRIPSLILLAMLSLLLGCKSNGFKTSNGDMGQFILQESLSLGGRPITTNDCPKIDSNWKFSKDEDGLVIQFSRKNYQAVESFLRHTYGTPYIQPTARTMGGTLGVYAAKSIGVAIQFGYEKDHAQVIILHAQKSGAWK